MLRAALGAACVLALAPAVTAHALAYVVLGPQGPVARAIVTDAQCPAISIERSPQRMVVRAMPDRAFPVLVCEFLIPAGTRSATIGDQALPLPSATLETIAALGDTGCRMKSAKTQRNQQSHDEEDAGKFQSCDKQSKWPFAWLSTSMAAARPDLVIHVGDYLYREARCPPGDAGCKGSPYGDNWQTWKADFFDPATPLLAAAPWIMIRGNHESCKRAGAGYFRFLDPLPAPPSACLEWTPHYTVTVADKSFIVMDSSGADDACAKCNSAAYAEDFVAMRPRPGSWWVSHRPVWAITDKSTLNGTLQQALAAWNGKLPDGIALALSGHLHAWQVLSFADRRSPQFIVGNGGTLLAHRIDRALIGRQIGGTTVSYARVEHRWGYTMLTPAQDGWTATFVDIDGKARFECMVNAEVSCR